MSIFLIGSIAFDEVGRFEGRFADAIHPDHLDKLSVSFLINQKDKFLGGCSGNIAYSLGLLNTPAYICGVVGEDGKPYKKALEDWGMNTDYLEEIEGDSAKAYMMSDLDQNQIASFAPGVLNSAGPFTLPEVAKAGDLFLVSPENHDRMIQVVEQASEKGLRVFFDPGQMIHTFNKEDLRHVLELANGLFVNDYEWELVKSITEWDEATLRSHLEVIFLTKGGEGADILSADGDVHVDAQKVAQVEDPTGAGDAFRAGVLAGLVKGLSLEESARIGTILGAACVAQKQTQGHLIKDQADALRSSGFPLEVA